MACTRVVLSRTTAAGSSGKDEWRGEGPRRVQRRERREAPCGQKRTPGDCLGEAAAGGGEETRRRKERIQKRGP